MRLTNSQPTRVEPVPPGRGRSESGSKDGALATSGDDLPRWVHVTLGLIVIMAVCILTLLALRHLCF